MNREQVISKLKKLFAVAENDASADGEIANAMAAANALMSAHQLTREDIVETETGELDLSKVVFSQTSRQSRYSSITSWESILCRFITKFVAGCGFYISPKSPRRNLHGMAVGDETCTVINFYGPECDVAFCCEIFDEVVLFIAAAANLRYGNALARGAAASYAEGFASALLDALDEEAAMREVVAESDCYALSVINRGLTVRKASRAWVQAQLRASGRGALVKGRRIKSAAHKDFEAYNQGREDGSDYKVGSTRKAGYLE